MRTFEVKVEKTIKLTEEDIKDILSACFYGGCSYWACIDNRTEDWKLAERKLCENGNDDPTIEDIIVWLLCNGYAVNLIDEEDNRYYEFNLWAFLDGISRTISEGYWNGDDIGDIDGEVGDVIIQYTVFGKIVYG